MTLGIVQDGKDWHGYILAPLGVLPEFQGRRIGLKLIESGKERLSEMGVTLLTELLPGIVRYTILRVAMPPPASYGLDIEKFRRKYLNQEKYE